MYLLVTAHVGDKKNMYLFERTTSFVKAAKLITNNFKQKIIRLDIEKVCTGEEPCK